MTTEEGNKLIAEFVGFKLVPHALKHLAVEGYKQWRTKDVKSPLWNFLEANQPEETWFHTSWDWLMPVVEKIERLHNEHTYFEVMIYATTCSIDGLSEADYVEKTKIEAVWQAVVSFIEWYNSQPKS